MRIFSAYYPDELTAQAHVSPRKRQHRNIHQSYEDPCHRLFNAIEPGSHIRPHRRAADIRVPLLAAVLGLMALVTFDEQGKMKGALHFGSDWRSADLAVGAEVPANTWNTGRSQI